MGTETAAFEEASGMLCPELSRFLKRLPETRKKTISEIRLRSGRPIALSDGGETLYADPEGKILYAPGRGQVCPSEWLESSFKMLCGYSLYSRQHEIRQGFLTLSGGHRVGVCGAATVKEGTITAVTDITSLNLRIARQIPGIALPILHRLGPITGGILMVGPPLSGKTTLLRDLARCISTGTDTKALRTAVIDERGELSGSLHGPIALDLGFSDVFRGYPKGEGIQQAVRAMSPQVILCDEVGTEEDAKALAAGMNAGAHCIATIHAAGVEELSRRPGAKRLLKTGAFEKILFLPAL